jgi:glutathione S-transferase
MKLYMHPVSMTSRPVRPLHRRERHQRRRAGRRPVHCEHHKEPYASLNPNRLVPMLEDGDLNLTECSAILKYLADKVGSPAYPKDLKQRAKVNEMMDWLNTNFYREYAYNLIYPQLFPHMKRPDPAVQKATLEWGKDNAKAG